jgi:hypothetical protein
MTPQFYERITSYFRRFYEVTLFERDNLRHPIHVYYPEPEQVDDVDSLMGRLHDKTPSEFTIYDQIYLHDILSSGRNVYNGKTFTLHHLERSPLKIHGQYGYYYDMLATCAALDHEVKRSHSETLMRLPLRTQLHRTLNISQAVWSGQGRSATIGGAVLIVFNQGGEYQAILAQRNQQSATDPGFFHVLPAFIFQPTRPDQPLEDIEWRISHHIYREYLEELFGAPEDETQSPHAIYEHPALIDLQAMLSQGQAGLYSLGITLNLLTLRPEICALLLIHDATWWQRIHDPNNPFTLNAHAEAQGGQLLTFPIVDDTQMKSHLPENIHLRMPAQAFVALHLGVELAREKIKSRT